MFFRDSIRVRPTPRCKTSNRMSYAVSSNLSYRARATSSEFKRRQRSATVPKQPGSRRCRYWHRRSRPRKWYRPKFAEAARPYKSDSERTISASRMARSRRTPSSSPRMTAKMLLDWKCPAGGTFKLTVFGHPIR